MGTSALKLGKSAFELTSGHRTYTSNARTELFGPRWSVRSEVFTRAHHRLLCRLPSTKVLSPKTSSLVHIPSHHSAGSHLCLTLFETSLYPSVARQMAGTDVQTIEFADSFRAYITNWRATSFGLVDSRLPADFTKVHVSGSTNVPHDDLSCRGTFCLDLIPDWRAKPLNYLLERQTNLSN